MCWMKNIEEIERTLYVNIHVSNQFRMWGNYQNIFESLFVNIINLIIIILSEMPLKTNYNLKINEEITIWKLLYYDCSW